MAYRTPETKLNRARFLALEHYNRRVPPGVDPLTIEDFKVQWFACSDSDNWNAMISCNADGRAQLFFVMCDTSWNQISVTAYTENSSQAYPIV